MDLRQLEYFVAVAEEANFTKAADRVHITQSGVSAQIRQFERELGTELFDRSSRMVRLTAAGQAALPYARSALAAAAAVRQAIDDVTGLVRGRLRVGMITGCTLTPLFDSLASFHRAYPRIGISLFEGCSEQLVDQVRAGETDLALIGTPGGIPDGLEAMTVASEALVALVPEGHALAALEGITLRRLCAYPLVCLPEGSSVRSVLDHACAGAGLRPNIALSATAPASVADLAERGLGVAVLSATMAAEQPALCAVPVAAADVSALMALVWQGQTSVLKALLPHCRRAFAG